MIHLLQVKVLYVRNLQLATTEDTIENLFKQFAEVQKLLHRNRLCENLEEKIEVKKLQVQVM